MERTLISWSVPNMVTIWLMFILGFLLLGLGTQLVARWNAPAQGANNAGGF